MTSLTGTLEQKLAQSLHRGVTLKVYHVSTPPTSCPALYAAAAGQKPEKTFCESHFILVTAPFKQTVVAILAIEIFVYTTAQLTTIFVSKADSTGHASALGLGRGSNSISKTVTSTFVSHLAETRHRADRKLVISLFARAQDQYLFPGSAEHSGKHVLSDRQLVKWWCKTLDPELQRQRQTREQHSEQKTTAQGYLIVPGFDRYETLAFLPAWAKSDKSWVNGHPLLELAPQPAAPPRCLVPHFPDDPKSRFLLDLDEEIVDAPPASQADAASQPSPSKRGHGMWKSVKTLEQFWEMMAFRQECSSGRLVGFIWIVCEPEGLEKENEVPDSPSLRPAKRKLDMSTDEQDTGKQAKRRKKTKLTGAIVPRAPRVKSNAAAVDAVAERTRHYYWPRQGRGSVILAEKAYKRATEILLRLDFASLEVASASTWKWAQEVGVIGGQSGDWGRVVVGTASTSAQAAAGGLSTAGASNGEDKSSTRGDGQRAQGGATILNMGLVRKKPKGGAEEAAGTKGGEDTSGVRTLGGNMVRKKAKT